MARFLWLTLKFWYWYFDIWYLIFEIFCWLHLRLMYSHNVTRSGGTTPKIIYALSASNTVLYPILNYCPHPRKILAAPNCRSLLKCVPQRQRCDVTVARSMDGWEWTSMYRVMLPLRRSKQWLERFFARTVHTPSNLFVPPRASPRPCHVIL